MSNEPKWTKGPLKLERDQQWPLYLAIVGADGAVLHTASRFALAAEMETPEDCLSGVGFSGDDLALAREGNRRQLADLTLWAAAPDLYAACVWAEGALAPFSKEPAEKSGISLLRAALAKANPDIGRDRI